MQIKSVLSKLTLLMLLSSYFTENRHRIKFDLPQLWSPAGHPILPLRLFRQRQFNTQLNLNDTQGEIRIPKW